VGIDVHQRESTTEKWSGAVLAAVAERLGTEEAALATPLHEAVDPEALDRLFRDGTGEVSFEYEGFLVTVSHTGSVDLTSIEPGGSGSAP
jgi:hypothetical protein